MGVAGEGHRIAVGQAVAGYGDVERGSRAPHPDNPGQPRTTNEANRQRNGDQVAAGMVASMLMVRLFSCVQVQTDATALVLEWVNPLTVLPRPRI